ncbi:MAG: SUKH-3 domain-containing protein [Oscillospiraceae bacterium]|nr:SUKH-3 domain-containing protein [Oscillospiraceae bacterium]
MNGMLNKIAEQQLRKAGWYPGRKIDISDQIKFWESLGYQTFDAAVKFMEEYGKLHITDKYISSFDNNLNEDHHTTFVTEILEFYNEYTEEDKFEFNNFGYAKENILPVIMIEDTVVCFIGESGIFYSDDGLRAENSEIFWNEYYGGYVGTDCGWCLPWDKIGTGKQRTRFIGNGKGCRNYI